MKTSLEMKNRVPAVYVVVVMDAHSQHRLRLVVGTL